MFGYINTGRVNSRIQRDITEAYDYGFGESDVI